MDAEVVRSPVDLGAAVRRRRNRLGLTQAELAEVAGVGKRFLSELERGKSTAEVGRVFRVVQVLGMDLQVAPRDRAAT